MMLYMQTLSLYVYTYICIMYWIIAYKKQIIYFTPSFRQKPSLEVLFIHLSQWLFTSLTYMHSIYIRQLGTVNSEKIVVSRETWTDQRKKDCEKIVISREIWTDQRKKKQVSWCSSHLRSPK